MENVPLVKMSTKITKETCLFVQTDDYAGDEFIGLIASWADQVNGPVHVSLDDIEDLQEYCKNSNHRLQEVLQAARELAVFEGIESIIFF